MPYGSGKYIYELEYGWAKLPEGESNLFEVPDIHIDAMDIVYITTRGDHPVMLFDQKGKLIFAADDGSFGFSVGTNRGNRHGIFVGSDGSIYVSNVGQHIVSKYTLEGKLLFELGTKDQPSDSGFRSGAGKDSNNVVKRGAPPFNGPTDVSLSDSGEIYISDGYFNASIHKFSSDGKLLLSWGEPGIGPSQFNVPHGIWVDKQEHVWICDRYNNRIQIFNNTGKFLGQWAGFKQPCNLWIDGQGTVYVVELEKRVSILDRKGRLITQFNPEENERDNSPLAPHSIAVDSKGNIYIGEISSSEVADRGISGVQKLLKFVKI